MVEYKAPLRDISFVMNELLHVENHYSELPSAEMTSPDVVEAIIQVPSSAKVCFRPLTLLVTAKAVPGLKMASRRQPDSRKPTSSSSKAAGLP